MNDSTGIYYAITRPAAALGAMFWVASVGILFVAEEIYKLFGGNTSVRCTL